LVVNVPPERSEPAQARLTTATDEVLR